MSGYDWSQHKWTSLEKLFVIEYLKDCNAKEAARRAGSKAKEANLKTIGCELRRKQHVADAIEWHIEQKFAAVNVTVDRIVREMAMIAFADMAPIFNEDGSIKPFVDWPEHCRRACSGIDIDELFEGYGEDRAQVGLSKKIRQWSKIDALQMLAKWRKMLTDKEIHTERTVVERYYDGKLRNQEQE